MPDWQRFDPLTAEIDGSRVTDYKVTATVTSAYFQLMGLEGDTSVTVMLFACGGKPHSLADESVLVDPAAGEPADPVGGAAAYWLPPNGPSDPLGLAWQWTPGAWAVVSAASPEPGQTPLNRDELRSLAARIAGQLELGVGTPVVAPFSLPVPDGMYATSTYTASADENGAGFPVGFGIGFNSIGTPEATTVGGADPDLWVYASYFAAVDDLPPSATPYPDLGYPAYQWDLSEEGRDWDMLVVYDFHGLSVEIEPRVIPGTTTETMDYAADIFRTITAYDADNWGNPIAG
jgi:hypothetical protein